MIQELTRGGLSVTAEQAAIVDHALTHSVTVVSAGAGSGKTHTTTATVLEMLSQRKATLDQFVLITFTNKAADELRSRLQKVLERRRSEALAREERLFWSTQQELLSAAYIGTIHGFCSLVLRTFGYEERVARESSITTSNLLLNESLIETVESYSERQDAALLDSPLAWREHELREWIRDILKFSRDAGLSPDNVLSDTENQPDDPSRQYRIKMARLVADVDREYTRRKREKQVLDSNDLLQMTVTLLTKPGGSDIVHRIGDRFHYLFVDEFQDTDRLQKQIVDALKARLTVLVVGDRKQSIYRFRSADVSLLQELADQSGVQILPLSVTRRPTKRLTDFQNVLFERIGQQFPDLSEQLSSPDEALAGLLDLAPMMFVSAGPGAQLNDRIRMTASVIQTLLAQRLDTKSGIPRKVTSGDIAILLRSNSRIQQYVQSLDSQLAKFGIGIRADQGGGLFERPEIASVYHMLRLLQQYPDDTALALALGTPYMRDVEADGKVLDILQYRPQEGTPLTDWFEATYPDYEQLLRDLRAAVRIDTVPQILGQLYKSFDIFGYYAQQRNRQAIGNLEKLREMARTLFNREQALTLSHFTQQLELAVNTRRDESEALVPADDDNDQASYVRVMTIHRSKGLEFPIVILPEVQVPLLSKELEPSFLVLPGWGLDAELPTTGIDTRSQGFQTQVRKDTVARLQEEMRLFYVAVTRAEQSVIFVGNDLNLNSMNGPSNRRYSWKDAIANAWPSLLQHGAVSL